MLTDTNVLICIENNIQMKLNEDLQKQENQERNKNFSTLIQSGQNHRPAAVVRLVFCSITHISIKKKQAFTAEVGSAAYEQDVI